MKSKLHKLAIIAGSGVEDLIFTKGFNNKEVKTKYGLVPLKIGRVEGREIVFINRHGAGYNAPHEIKYLANMQALRQIGVSKIIASVAVGSMNKKVKPGEFVILSDFIDFTKSRQEYFNPSEFTDVTCPYHEGLRKALQKSARKMKIKIHPSAIYVCTEGPRFETKAEIKMYQRAGGDVVGMTNVPEVVLAMEAEIPYAALGVVTNYAAGISPKKISTEEVMETMRIRNKALSALLLQTLRDLP
jgi:5'-methylthioadenosine phosphorylase